MSLVYWVLSGFTVFANPLPVQSLDNPLQTLEHIDLLSTREWEPNTQNWEFLWRSFWWSRLDLIAEDPDIFERSIDTILKVCEQNTSSCTSSLLDIQIDIAVQSTLYFTHQRYPSSKKVLVTIPPAIKYSLKLSLEESISEYLNENTLEDKTVVDWLRSWTSPGGSNGMEFQKLILKEFATLLGKNADQTTQLKILQDWGLENDIQLGPPDYEPGQVVGISPPIQPTIEFTNYRKKFDWTFVIIFLIGGFLLKETWNKRTQPFGKSMLGSTIAILVFVSLELLLYPLTLPLIELQPMFALSDWDIDPWTETSEHFITQGPYLRAQKIDKYHHRRRLVIVGASSAHGSNELWEDTFAGILQDDLDWDVVNLAIGGTTSTGIVHLMDDISRLNPSALVVFYGHNEVKQFRMMNNLNDIPTWRYKLQRQIWRSRTYSFFHGIINIDSIEITQNKTNVQQSDDTVVQLATWNFKTNLTTICNTIDVPTIFLTPPTNYPFAHMGSPESMPKSIEDIQNLIDADIDSTTIHSSIKDSIPEIAKECGATHWDVDHYFHINSPDNTSANQLFWDELHPSATGHEWIAQGIKDWLLMIEVQ